MPRSGRTVLVAGAIFALSTALVSAQGTSTPNSGTAKPAESANQPTPGANSGTDPKNAGSTGWSGGTGGSYIGTSPHAPTPGSPNQHPDTAKGLDPTKDKK